MQRNTGYFPTGSLEPSSNRLFSRSALNEGYLFRGSLNNGITIIASKIETEGDEITIFDYQIVNGCQTSRVVFDNNESLSDQSCVLAKIIQVENEDVLDKVVYTTNRQTEVKYEAFSSANRFHKKLQE